MKYLVKCDRCGKIYKCDGKVSVKGLRYVTDYNDDVTEKCIVCGEKMNPDVIKTDSWIAALFFKVKGN